MRAWLGQLEEWFIAFLLAALTLVTFMQVVARYVFNYSFTWALELTGFIFAAIIFLGMSYGVRKGIHIGIDAVVNLFPYKIRHVIIILGTILCIVYASIVFYGGWIYVERMYDIGIYTQDLPIKAWVPRVVLPLGYLLLIWRFAQILWRLLRGEDLSLLGDEAEEAMQYMDEDARQEIAK